jgi:hypothetical protein
VGSARWDASVDVSTGRFAFSSRVGGRLAWSPDGKDIAFWGPAATNGPAPSPMWRQAVSDAGPQASGTVATPSVSSRAASWEPGPSNATPTALADRVGGRDRIATAVAASQYAFDAADAGGRQANVAVLSRSDNFADALAGNALAAETHGPLLLAGPTGLSADETSVLTTNHLTGLVGFGGQAAVPDAVIGMAAETALGAFPTNWVWGLNRQAPALP